MMLIISMTVTVDSQAMNNAAVDGLVYKHGVEN